MLCSVSFDFYTLKASKHDGDKSGQAETRYTEAAACEMLQPLFSLVFSPIIAFPYVYVFVWILVSICQKAAER